MDQSIVQQLHAEIPDTCSLACLATYIQVLDLFLACAVLQWTFLVLIFVTGERKPTAIGPCLDRMLGVFMHRPCGGEQTGAQVRLAFSDRRPAEET
uniref:Uncharacterized protein n=1 Tax=Hyaloperonospora arabidopsidis (strain Emoy2) TaxID=559515 RepID=M4B817_HYAAE